MSTLKTLGGLLLVLTVAGCASDQELLANQQDMAIQTALSRGKFELNCPAATGTVLSQETVQPVIRGPMVGGVERVQYTIGVAGCDQRKSYVVICEVGGSGCFAADGQ
jgi:hypothetical protein